MHKDKLPHLRFPPVPTLARVDAHQGWWQRCHSHPPGDLVGLQLTKIAIAIAKIAFAKTVIAIAKIAFAKIAIVVSKITK